MEYDRDKLFGRMSLKRLLTEAKTCRKVVDGIDWKKIMRKHENCDNNSPPNQGKEKLTFKNRVS